MHCVKCAKSYYVRFLASAKSLSPFKFMSVIHSTETASWLLNVIARFRLESVFCCCGSPLWASFFSSSFSTWDVYLTVPCITPHQCTWTYTLPPFSPLTSVYPSLPSCYGPPEPLRWSWAIRQMVGGGDAATNHQPLDLYGPSFSPCINL